MSQVEVLAAAGVGLEDNQEEPGVIIFTSGRSRKQRTRRLLDSFDNSPKNRPFFPLPFREKS